MPDPRTIAEVAEHLRDHSIELFDRLTPEQLEQVALPARHAEGEAWTVADVFRHLAESDRQSVLGTHLTHFLPFNDGDAFEDNNDEMIQRLRGAPRQQLREELVAWGRRLRRIIRLTPGPLARVKVPTLFGRVALWWLATLRVYDEWIHQDDIARALDLDPPEMDVRTRALLAEFQLRALPAEPLSRIGRRSGVVEVAFEDALSQPAWRFDLSNHQYGPRVTATPTVRISTDVPTWSRIAADRIGWKDAESGSDLTIEGDDREAAEALLEVVRVV